MGAKQKGLRNAKGKQNKKASEDRNSHDVQHILSVSNDGKLCIWRTDELSGLPLNQSVLKPSEEPHAVRQIELITTCFDYSFRDSGNVVLGSDEGFLYKAEMFSAGAAGKESTTIKESIGAHHGPITGVQFFPIEHYAKTFPFQDNVSGLFLTASYDWTVKLWHNKLGTASGNGKAQAQSGNGEAQSAQEKQGPFSVFDTMTDYVHDVKWSPGGKPGVFACCDGEGKVNLFDLARDFKHPLTKKPIDIAKDVRGDVPGSSLVAATTLEWGLEGKQLAVGDSDGNVLMYTVHRSLAQQTLESCEKLQAMANQYVCE